MGKISDFKTKYAPKVFAIDPAFSFESTGCGWASLNDKPAVLGGDKNKPLINRSGVLKPFSSESSLGNMIELAIKLKQVWQEDAGYSSEPRVLVIERPIIYPGSPIRYSSITDLSILTGIFIAIFNPGQLLAPCPAEWKGNKKKEITEAEIIKLADNYSLQNIKRDMESIAIHKRHNAYDAIGLGIYAIKVMMGEIKPPRLHYPVKV